MPGSWNPSLQLIGTSESFRICGEGSTPSREPRGEENKSRGDLGNCRSPESLILGGSAALCVHVKSLCLQLLAETLAGATSQELLWLWTFR